MQHSQRNGKNKEENIHKIAPYLYFQYLFTIWTQITAEKGSLELESEEIFENACIPMDLKNN